LRNIPEERRSYMYWCLYWRCEVNDGSSCRFVARTKTVHKMCANTMAGCTNMRWWLRRCQISSNLC